MKPVIDHRETMSLQEAAGTHTQNRKGLVFTLRARTHTHTHTHTHIHTASSNSATNIWRALTSVVHHGLGYLKHALIK